MNFWPSLTRPKTLCCPISPPPSSPISRRRSCACNLHYLTFEQHQGTAMTLRRPLLSTVAALGLLMGATAAVAQTQTIQPDERTTLSAGLHDAGQAASNMVLEHSVAPPPGFFDPEALFAPAASREEAEAMAARNKANPPRYGP